ncbi:TPA: hypothetical protein RQK43_003682 [Vibrio vulnificus]|uniref:hypothetical protein n=1 Tax=Vibrio vulnificus TaxID=672 RepID=UPI0019D41657|nr:hypothetical protein [Vibrio vulnificus]MBN8146237.1 hypothetical protein [Vibrio vulnificus]HAS6162750.1 hypothetical protein [Vibrio vulnificus]HDY7730600.1 hypothetical protein [Vibrio vulnificus]HDY7863909.1 hypothetical protein [Vibrio vulnificus]HDY7877766.1 hypothetical protein [Vibrio vulnificus]
MLAAYDVYKVYEEDGIAGAVKALIEEGITNVVTGGLARGAKVGKTVVQKVAKAVEDSSKSLPNNQLQLAAESDKAPSFTHIDDAKTNDSPISSQQAGATDSAGVAKEAQTIRDATANQLKRKHATYAGGHKDGKVVSGCSSNPVGCAEDNIARQLGSDAQMTGAKGWRTNKATGEREYRDIPVCTNCL